MPFSKKQLIALLVIVALVVWASNHVSAAKKYIGPGAA